MEFLHPANVARSWHWFRQVTEPYNVACGSVIVTVNLPTGSTLQCDTWLWDDMPLNSPKRPPYWNSTFGFHIHTSPQSTCLSVPVCEILSKSDHTRQNKMKLCRFSRWRISFFFVCFFVSFLFGVAHAPFACQRWGLPHRLAQCATPRKGLV